MPIRVAAPLNLREIVAGFCGLPVHAKANRWLLSNKEFWGEKQDAHPTGQLGAKSVLGPTSL
jgi:hypothetical protein